MTNTYSAYQTILLIGLGKTDAPAAGMTQTVHEEQLAFIRAVLQDSGLCRDTWTSDDALIGAFPSVESAFDAACGAQQACREHGGDSLVAEVRMLLDRQDGVIIDDAVSSPVDRARDTAKQLMKLIPPGQIFATDTVKGQLGEESRARFRLYEQGTADAGADDRLYRVTCNEETITRLAIPARYLGKSDAPPSLRLRWRENTMTVLPETPTLTIGRGEQSDIRIESDLASRIHARLEFQQSNFILTDQSTNGTFVQIDDDEEVYLHHEQIVLRGSGVISLGRLIRAGSGIFIYFKQTV